MIVAPAPSLIALLATPVILVSFKVLGSLRVISPLISVVAVTPEFSPPASLTVIFIAVSSFLVVSDITASVALPLKVSAVTVPGKLLLPDSSSNTAV